MKKKLSLALIVTLLTAECFSQSTLSNLGVSPTNPATVPINISQLEVSGRLLTQN